METSLNVLHKLYLRVRGSETPVIDEDRFLLNLLTGVKEWNRSKFNSFYGRGFSSAERYI